MKKDTCDFNHLILYAKGWYQWTNRVDDVRKILAHRCLIYPEHFSDSDVWQCSVHALETHCPGKTANILADIFKPMPGESNPFTWFSELCPLPRALYYILCELSHLTVKDKDGNWILNLGDPDPAVLPVKEEGKSSDIEQPYLFGYRVDKVRSYNKRYGDDRLCKCGHPYYRHFDSHEDMLDVGCKYCRCFEFVEAQPDSKDVLAIVAEQQEGE